MRDGAYCGGRFVCAPLHGQVCAPRGSVPWVSWVCCVGTASEHRSRRRQQRIGSLSFPHPRLRGAVFYPPNALGAGLKNISPRPTKTAPTLGGGIAYIETREGEIGGRGRLDGNPDAPALEEGFTGRNTAPKIQFPRVHITLSTCNIILFCHSFFPMAHLRRADHRAAVSLIGLHGL